MKLKKVNTPFLKINDKALDLFTKWLQGAVNTQIAYQSDIQQFIDFCKIEECTYLPATPDTIANYIAFMSERYKLASIQRKLASITKRHQLHNIESPTQHRQIKIIQDGLKREKTVQQKQAPAFDIQQLYQIVHQLDTGNIRDIRNKAIFLLGFTGAFRRSELSALQVEHLDFQTDCLIVQLSHSKNNQFGEQEHKAIFYASNPILCPIRSLQKRIKMLGRVSWALFVSIKKGGVLQSKSLSTTSINTLVKQYFQGDFTSHSLRASFVTIAKKNGAQDSEIMQQTKHKTTAMIRRYTRIQDVREHNAGMKLGL